MPLYVSYYPNMIHIIIKKYNKFNKSKVFHLGDLKNCPWKNKGPKPYFNPYRCKNNLNELKTLKRLKMSKSQSNFS